MHLVSSSLGQNRLPSNRDLKSPGLVFVEEPFVAWRALLLLDETGLYMQFRLLTRR